MKTKTVLYRQRVIYLSAIERLGTFATVPIQVGVGACTIFPSFDPL